MFFQQHEVFKSTFLFVGLLLFKKNAKKFGIEKKIAYKYIWYYERPKKKYTKE